MQPVANILINALDLQVVAKPNRFLFNYQKHGKQIKMSCKPVVRGFWG